ncbi:hypothetical protein ACHAXT_002735 [Thalassiosira profunda]
MAMGLFAKLVPSPAQPSPQHGKDWIPTAIEFATSADEAAECASRESSSLGGHGASYDALHGGGVMVGRGRNSRQAGQAGPAGVQTPNSTHGEWRSDMTGRGMNSSRLSNDRSNTNDSPGANPFVDDSEDGSSPNKSEKESRNDNPFDLEYESSGDEESPQPIGNSGRKKNPFLDDDSDDVLASEAQAALATVQGSKPSQGSKKSGKKSNKNKTGGKKVSKASKGGDSGSVATFEDAASLMEEKLSKIDTSQFLEFDDDDDDRSSATPLSYIEEEESGESSGLWKDGVNPRASSKREAPKKKKSGFGKLFGKKKAKASGRNRDRRGSDESDDEDEGYISGEFDEEFDNSEGFVPTNSRGPNSRSAGIADAAIGVPSANGRTMTSRQLEDELYLYKLETLNLTDACRDLAEQLEEVESKLESVQAQATFRIHALEAELQDGNLGLKSLVKMTSTEMDGRLDALRALGKTATVQAAKLKQRDSELINVEQKLRKARRDVKNLKRDNKKVMDERQYLKGRLDELDQAKMGLEEDLKMLAVENADAEAALTAEEKERAAELQKRLDETVEQMGHFQSQLEGKEKEVGALREQVGEREGEILEMKEALDRKGELALPTIETALYLASRASTHAFACNFTEHDIVHTEQQLEKVRNDLLDAANAAKTAEEARVDAEGRESSMREELDETMRALEEVTAKVAILESQETELRQQLESAQCNEDDEEVRENQKARLAELEKEVESLRQEKEDALVAVNDAQAAYADSLADREAQIETLNKDVDVHREQMELAQTMLEEKETLAAELRVQLEEMVKEEDLRMAQLEEDLAAKSREVKNVSAELEERTMDVGLLEEKLEKARKELVEQRAEAEGAKSEAVGAARAQAAVTEKVEDDSSSHPEEAKEKEEPVQLAPAVASSAQLAERMAELAEKETQIERLERELGTSKRQLDATQVELEEKDKHAERLKAEVERMKTDRGARVEELEKQLEEKNESVESLRKELDDEKGSLDVLVDKLNNLQIDLDAVLEAKQAAEEARDAAVSEMESGKTADDAAKDEAEKLQAQIEELRKTNESAAEEVKALKEEAEKEKKSSTQAAATLAATNAARQAEMEMKIEKMTKEIEFKKREIDAIKSELKEKDVTADNLRLDLDDAKADLAKFKESAELAQAKVEEEKEVEALQRVAERDYFDDVDDVLSDDVLSVANSVSTAGGSSKGMGLLGGLFNRGGGGNDGASLGENVDWEAQARQKDRRITELEKSLADNALSISNLKSELVTASTKFKEDESQRRLLIQRLENENQAYSIKLEVLETEFEEIRKRKEAVAVAKSSNSFLTDDGSVASSVHSTATGDSGNTGVSSAVSSYCGTQMTGVSTITGSSRLTPLERDNKKLKKQKKVYETRIASLQTQLSEIQQIVPELMSKSKSQIQKLETVIETQRTESEEKEKKLREEVEELKRTNEQLQAATRSRLQSTNVDQQEEIDQLKMRLEAREATIKKLEMLASSKSLRKRGGKLMRKKKKKKDPNNDSVSVLSESSWGTAHHSLATYSVAEDTTLSGM